jgi:hypothetical protein
MFRLEGSPVIGIFLGSSSQPVSCEYIATVICSRSFFSFALLCDQSLQRDLTTMSHSPMEEKIGVSKLETIDTGDYDPDAGLSDEERAKIVNCLLSPSYSKDTSTNQLYRTKPSSED